MCVFISLPLYLNPVKLFQKGQPWTFRTGIFEFWMVQYHSTNVLGPISSLILLNNSELISNLLVKNYNSLTSYFNFPSLLIVFSTQLNTSVRRLADQRNFETFHCYTPGFQNLNMLRVFLEEERFRKSWNNIFIAILIISYPMASLFVGVF